MSEPREHIRYLELLRSELKSYRQLRELLGEQFDTVLHHRVEKVAEAGNRITDLVDAMNQQRDERITIARTLTGEAVVRCHSAMLRLLSPASAALLSAWVRELEALVEECKRMNLHNCSLLVEQYEVMQRVLNPEGETYAPA